MGENELTSVENELGVSDNYWKVFGFDWNINKDIFVFEFSDIAESGLELVYFKRSNLKIGESFFDPLGWFVHLFCKLRCSFKNCVS